MPLPLEAVDGGLCFQLLVCHMGGPDGMIFSFFIFESAAFESSLIASYVALIP